MDCYNTGSSGILRFLTQSDHYPIFTMRKNVLPHEPIQYITKRIHNQQNIARFRKHMESSNWTMMGLYQKKPISVIYLIYYYYSTIVSFKDLMRSQNPSGYFSFYVDNISIKTYSTWNYLIVHSNDLATKIITLITIIITLITIINIIILITILTLITIITIITHITIIILLLL